jgi:hypothetical protein
VKALGHVQRGSYVLVAVERSKRGLPSLERLSARKRRQARLAPAHLLGSGHCPLDCYSSNARRPARPARRGWFQEVALVRRHQHHRSCVREDVGRLAERRRHVRGALSLSCRAAPDCVFNSHGRAPQARIQRALRRARPLPSRRLDATLPRVQRAHPFAVTLPAIAPGEWEPQEEEQITRRLSVPVVLALALVLPASAATKVRVISLTSPINAGAYATLAVAATPARTCSITVYYKSGPSEAQGLYPKRSSSSGRVSWTWKVGTRTTPGRWPIVVSCGSAGMLRTSFVVR